MLTLREIFLGVFAFAEAHAALYFALAVAVPLLGTLAAWMGRGGKTERDGILYANLVVIVAVAQFVLAMVVGSIGMVFLERSLWDAHVLVVLAPGLWLVLSVFLVRRVFPLSQLATWRSVVEAGQFFVACAVLVWLFSQFRGWGILFFGSLLQLLIVLALAGVVLNRLFVRAFRTEG
ncbi:MAG TPA: hypothetical protein VGA70_12305 [Longimicrobiales bacterium]|jgi:hypothetical protein